MRKIELLIEKKEYLQILDWLLTKNPHDIAMHLEYLDLPDMLKIFRLFPKDVAAEVFSEFSVYYQKKLIDKFNEQEINEIVTLMYSDDFKSLLEEMPSNMVTKILADCEPGMRSKVNELLRYPSQSAGSIMGIEFIELDRGFTVRRALDKIRRVAADKETIDNSYVIDEQRRLIGVVSIKQLVIADPDSLIEEVMNEKVISVMTLDDQEKVAKTIQKYDFTAMPVVDKENRLVGIVTVDDLVDIIEAEATEDIHKMAAVMPSDMPYIEQNAWQIFKKRIPWLLILMITAIFTGLIIENFETELLKCVALTAFLPMLMNTGGNAGNQSSVTIIRSISLNEIKKGDLKKVLAKEFIVGVMSGVVLFSAAMIRLMLLDSTELNIALVVSITLFIVVVVAKLIGATLPIAAKKLGADPAVMASPFITTIVDALALLIYFKIAIQLLGL